MPGLAAVVLVPLLASAPSLAEEVVLRNDTNTSDTFDSGEAVIWLEYPECAISVLTPDPADYPLEIHSIQFFFVSNTGELEGESGYTELGIQLLDEGAAPTGRGDWIWGEEAFYTTASSDSLNELSLVDAENGWEAVTLEEGSIAVWLCPTDPSTGADWPYNSASDTTGIVVDGGSPSAGNYAILGDNKVYKLKDLGVSGSWVIRAIAGEGGGGADGGGDDGGDDGGGDDGGGDVVIASVTPASVMEGVSATIAVVGEGFDEDATAFIGGLAVSSVVVSGDSALTGNVPSALPVGTHDVLVNNPDGSSATLPAAFTVLSSEEVDGDGGCACTSAQSSPGTGWLLLPLVGLLAQRRRSHRA